MKRIFFEMICLLLPYLLSAQNQQQSVDSFYQLSPIEIRSVRAADLAPFTKTNIRKKEIEKMNLGQDIPFLLNQTPGVVISSDAGNGIGYTGIRIRGTDASRINITLNGIPFNDAESQGSFFVDLPDFSSSTGSIQVQRGVGTSSNGAGAFGASINLSTNEINKEAYAELNNSFGSFNSWKNTLKAGTGLLDNHFTADMRLSSITSDGYIDRAFSKLKSLQFSMAYINRKSSLRFNIFSGNEKTYQAWNGITEADLKAGKRKTNYAGTEKTGEPYNNEIDKYEQNHYQLFFTHQFSKHVHFNISLFKVDGRGYYEQYKADQSYAKYGLPDVVSSSGTVTHTDMVRRLWLDNTFFGNVFSLQYKNKIIEANLGGSISRYNGQHFGKIIWAAQGLTGLKKWYDLNAHKTDANIYLKQQINIATNWFGFLDLQYRTIHYDINGFRNNPALQVNNDYHFFNPKAGISFIYKNWKGYLSFGIAQKEPNRDDFETGLTQQPRSEKLYDTELGIEKKESKYNWATTFYFMQYKNQLVLTGKINDVGAYTRTNIPQSYRAGIELQGSYQLSKKITANANIALSSNKLKNFSEYIDDYDNGGQKINHYPVSTISFSPGVVGGAGFHVVPFSNFEIALISKYVSKQYLDNTSNENRKLDAYFTEDVLFSYQLKTGWAKEIKLLMKLNNVLNAQYEPNGYTYNYIYNQQLAVNNYYFPMAGTNFMLGVNIKL